VVGEDRKELRASSVVAGEGARAPSNEWPVEMSSVKDQVKESTEDND
jgi:hypothetical protein